MRRFASLFFGILLTLSLFTVPLAVAAAEGPPARYIVVLAEQTSVADAYAPVHRSDARAVAQEVGAEAEQVYDSVLPGFAAYLTARQVRALLANSQVAAVVPDQETFLANQAIPSGVQRIGTLQNTTARLDGNDDPFPINVAVLDTGIDPSHPDLNVVGGYDCTRSGSWVDRHSHGTHVAGIIGARDNSFGVVGVAPGARLWAVKVFRDDGVGYVSWLICGLNWVAANAATIRVANYSGGASGSDTPNCGGRSDPLHQAVCRVVQAGVTLVVAAGNDGRDASNTVPAAYPETIAVGAIVDTDGLPGGLGPGTSAGPDDSRASFSNYGPVVDIYAPGVRILSTVPGGGYQAWSGTSMATPHVVGAAALYLATSPGASPAQIRQYLLGSGEPGPWDSYGQPLVRVATGGGGNGNSGDGQDADSGGGGSDSGNTNSPATVDIAVTDLTAPTSGTVGTSLSIQVTVQNNGTTRQSVTLTLTANGSRVRTARRFSLSPGATRTVTFSWRPRRAGEYTLVARATLSGTDANPSDNERLLTVRIDGPQRDVAIADLVSPSTVRRGQSATVEATVTNTGNVPATITVQLRTSPRNAAMGTIRRRLTLQPGASQTVTFTWRTNTRTALTTYTITVVATLSGDNNPSDNSRSATITVTNQ